MHWIYLAVCWLTKQWMENDRKLAHVAQSSLTNQPSLTGGQAGSKKITFQFMLKYGFVLLTSRRVSYQETGKGGTLVNPRPGVVEPHECPFIEIWVLRHSLEETQSWGQSPDFNSLNLTNRYVKKNIWQTLKLQRKKREEGEKSPFTSSRKGHKTTVQATTTRRGWSVPYMPWRLCWYTKIWDEALYYKVFLITKLPKGRIGPPLLVVYPYGKETRRGGALQLFNCTSVTYTEGAIALLCYTKIELRTAARFLLLGVYFR